MGKAFFLAFFMESYYGRLAVVLYWALKFSIFLVTQIQLLRQFGEPSCLFLV
jgi:hypothetical protein